MYLLLPLSGSFFMVAWMPRDVQEMLQYVPMINAIEMFRAGYLGPSVPTFWDAGYLFLWGLAANVVGLALVGRATRSLAVQ